MYLNDMPLKLNFFGWRVREVDHDLGVEGMEA